MTIQKKIEDIVNRVLFSIKDFLGNEEDINELAMRKIEEVASWDGSAGQWDDAESYCSACLIDVNAAAGNDEKKKEYCKLPVKAPGSSSYADKGIMAATGSHGIQAVKKPDGVSDEDWEKAVKKAANKIISLYGEMGKDCPDAVYEIAGKAPPERAISMSGIYDALWNYSNEAYRIGNDLWPNDLFLDNDGSLYAIFISSGKLFRASVTMQDGNMTVGELQEVEVIHQPRQRFTIQKQRQADGTDKYRWINISCSAALDKSGEIDSRDLFDSFEQNFDIEDQPYRDFYHLGTQYRTGTIDFVARDENVLVTSGIYDDSVLAELEIKARIANPEYWGDSITYVPTSDPELWDVGNGITIPVYKTGVLRAVATLPVKDAASYFVKSTMQEVNRMTMTKTAFAAFLKFFDGDEEKAKAWLVSNVDPTNRTIVESGAITRAASEQTADPVTETAETDPVPEGQTVQLEVTDEFVERVADVLMQRIDEKLSGFSTTVETLRSETEALKAKIDAYPEFFNRLDAVEKQVNTVRQAYIDDLPAGKVVLKLSRPSTRTVEPSDPPTTTESSDEPETAAEVAEATLAKIAAY